MHRRTLPALLAGLFALPATAALGRPARLVVGAAPGGGTDTLARLLAERLSGHYAPQVVVENRTGASSRIAAEAVKAALPDGTTVLLAPLPVLALFPHTLPRTTRYNPVVDFTPATTVGELAYGFAVRADHPARTLADFIAWAKAKGDVNFAPPVLGAPQHMLGLVFARQAGLAFTVIPYRTNAQAHQDLLAGRLDCFMSHLAELAPSARSGQARLLAISSPGRLARLPGVASFAEQGFPALTATEAIALMLPAATPPEVAEALHGAVAAAVAQPDMAARLALLELSPLALSPQALKARLAQEYAAWGPVVAASGFVAEE